MQIVGCYKMSVIDEKIFARLISDFTGIKVTDILKYAASNNITNIIEHPDILDKTDKQRDKINDLRELFRHYVVLKEDLTHFKMNNSDVAGEFIKNYYFSYKDREVFSAFYLDSGNNIIAMSTISDGVANECPVYVGKIVKEALLHDSVSVIVAHNHPGGTLKPSREDLFATSKLTEALKLFKITLQDHFIVTDKGFYSLAENDEVNRFNSKVMSTRDLMREESDELEPFDLVTASIKGHSKTVKFLLENGVNPNGLNGEALKQAQHLGHKDIVNTLISKGANIQNLEIENHAEGMER